MLPEHFPAWLASVHHDGSQKYVSNPYPRLGDKVLLRLRHSPHAPIERVVLRTFPDGEQHYTPMQPGPLEPAARWWEVELVVDQPIFHYRFSLQAADGVWLYSAGGPSAHDPLDIFDFRLLAGYRPPSWLSQAVFYQIFPDRFANGDPSTDPRPEEYDFRGHRPHTYPWGSPPESDHFFGLVFYGGDLPGIQQRLDYLQELGVNALYLNPIFTAYTNHKYDVADYEHVDPHFGGDGALQNLSQALRERGMRYILDIVPNHSGYMHPWFQAARQDASAPEAEFYTFNQHPDDYATWLGVWALPKLNYRSQELRERIYASPQSVFRRWLRPPYSAAGWRVDVANMLGRQGADQLGVEVTQGIRQAVKSTDPEAYLIGENFFDATPQLQGDQYDGVMNYMGFKTPLLYWLRGYRQRSFGMSDAITSPVPWPTAAFEQALRERRAAIPWVIALQQFNLLDSHDTSRIRSELHGNDNLLRLAVILLFTYPGTPCIYYGDEIGMQDDDRLSSRGCMIWDETNWDHDLLAFYRQLIALRKSSAALQTGGFQTLAVESDLLAYLREDGQSRYLIVAQRSPTPRLPGPLPVAHAAIPDGMLFKEHFSGVERAVENGCLPLPEQPQGATIWKQVISS